jgi:hypothetical protein
LKTNIMRNINDDLDVLVAEVIKSDQEIDDELFVEQVLQESRIILGWEQMEFLLKYALSHPLFT